MTLTLNPAIDETIHIDHLKVGEVHRAKSVRFDAGGKGINVAACLGAYGIDVAATGFLGSENVNFFEDFLKNNHIQDEFIRLEGATRTNIKIVTSSQTTDINLPGLAPNKSEIEELNHKLRQKSASFLVIAGSLPPSCSQELYADLVAGQHARHGFSIVDCSGKPLNYVLSAPYLPTVIKPNIVELTEWVGHPLTQFDDILKEGRRLHQSGIALVVISMGEEGALFISRNGAVHASFFIPQVTSTVGAGDAMVAGIVASLIERADLEKIARLSTAFAVGKLIFAGDNLPPKDFISKLEKQIICRTI